jgi:hypothetical protein
VSQQQWRLGVYECEIKNGILMMSTNSPIWYRYVPFPPSAAEEYKKLIWEELTKFNRAIRPFQYPILVMSWRLGPGQFKDSTIDPKDRHGVFASNVGGLRNLKKLAGFPIKRVEVPGIRKREVVIFGDGRVVKVENISPIH